MDFDLIIVGGGPAGATLARLLPRSMRCAVIYRSDLSKPCGGLLSEDAQCSLARYDITLPKDVLVDPQIFSVKTIDLEAGLVRHYQRTYLNMDRQKFDAWLLDMVPCQRIDGQVIAVERLTEGYRVTLVGGQQMPVSGGSGRCQLRGTADSVPGKAHPQLHRHPAVVSGTPSQALLLLHLRPRNQ